MNIVSFLSDKGGSTKTTSALTLGSALAYMNYNVTMFDFDFESSVLSRWASKRETYQRNPIDKLEIITATTLQRVFSDPNADLYTWLMDTKKMAQGQRGDTSKDFFIVDMAGGKEGWKLDAAFASDLIITPMTTSTADLEGVRSTGRLASKAMVQSKREDNICRVMVNRVPINNAFTPKEVRDAMLEAQAAVTGLGMPPVSVSLGDRVGYQRMFRMGETQYELPLAGMHNTDDLINETQEFARYVLEQRGLISEDKSFSRPTEELTELGVAV